MLITEIKSIDDIKETKTYLPFIQKEYIINNIIETVTEFEENNLVKINYLHLDFFFDIEILKYYFDIEIPSDIETELLINTYDYLCDSDILPQLKTRICDDYDYLVGLLDKEIKQKVENNNSISGVIAKNLAAIADKIPDEKAIKRIFKAGTKMFNSLNKDNLEAIGIQGFLQDIKNKYTASAISGKK